MAGVTVPSEVTCPIVTEPEAWAIEEFEALAQIPAAPPKGAADFLMARGAGLMPPRDLAVLRELFQLREEWAQRADEVRVVVGAFANFSGTVQEVKPDKQKLKVMVSIFGRPTPVELDFSHVEKR